MRAVISILFWIIGIILTVILWLAVLISTILFYPFDKKRKIGHWHTFWWAELIIRMNPFWRLEITGEKNMNKNTPYVIIANHQSLGDIIVAYKIRTQFKWVAKESLFKLPFLGWIMSLIKHIRITRGKFGSIKQVYKEAAIWLRNGISVIFFPEGTRSETDSMREFQNGAFKLAIKEKKAILPVAIVGTRQAIPKGSWVFKANVKGKVKILPPVDTAPYKPGDFALLRDRVRGIIEAAIGEG